MIGYNEQVTADFCSLSCNSGTVFASHFCVLMDCFLVFSAIIHSEGPRSFILWKIENQ